MELTATTLDPYTIIRKYYTEGSELYNILTRHSEDVASLALEIAKNHPELNLDQRFIYEAAMLHDIGIFLTDAPGIACHGSEPYIKHGFLGAELLRREGLPRHAFVAERHTGSGLTESEIQARQIDLPAGIYTPQTLEEKLICYADKFYSKTKLGQRKLSDKVHASLLKHGGDSLARFEELERLFA